MALLPEIQKAFQDVEYPGDDNIIKDIEYPESYEMWLEFKGKHWRDISAELAEYWRINYGRLTGFAPAMHCATANQPGFDPGRHL